MRDAIRDKRDDINQTVEELSRHMQTENIDDTRISTSTEDMPIDIPVFIDDRPEPEPEQKPKATKKQKKNFMK